MKQEECNFTAIKVHPHHLFLLYTLSLIFGGMKGFWYLQIAIEGIGFLHSSSSMCFIHYLLHCSQRVAKNIGIHDVMSLGIMSSFPLFGAIVMFPAWAAASEPANYVNKEKLFGKLSWTCSYCTSLETRSVLEQTLACVTSSVEPVYGCNWFGLIIWINLLVTG